MIRRLLLAVAFAVPTVLTAAPEDALAQRGAAVENGEEINLAVGETKTISAQNVKNYSEGVAGVIDIKLTSDNANFVINGKRPGSTTLLLIRSDGSQITLNINVFLRSPQVVEKELSQLLDGIPGIRVRRVGARIVIDGNVATEAEVKRVNQVAAMYPGQVEALANIAGQAGAAVSPDDQKKFLIRMDFYFVQYDRNSSYGVGLGWPAAIGGDTVVRTEFTYDLLSGGPRTATASLVDQPIPRLDIASRRGWAKVLKQATVITNNGQEASFSNGGEQLFPINQGLTIGIQRVQFGADLSIAPKYNPKNRDLDIKVVADIADLTPAVSGTPLPGRNTSKLTTAVSLKLGQSLVLSGIRTKSQSRSITGIPFLSEIPVLGLLFGSHGNSEIETEGAIFIVPSVVEAVPTSAHEMVENALSKFRAYDGNIDTVNTYDKNPGARPVVPPGRK